MNKVRYERKKRGWRQEDLAHYAKLSVSDVSRYESGRMVPYPNHALRIAKVLKLKAEELMEEVANR